MPLIRNSVQQSVKQHKHKQQDQLEEEMPEMLNLGPGRVCSATSTHEPAFVREYAPLPLEEPRSTQNI